MGQTSSKSKTTSSSQPPPIDLTMNTPSKLTPDDRGTFELLLQMGYTAQDALQQMTQPPVATPSANGNMEASNTTLTATTPGAVLPMVQEGSQRPPSNTVNTEKPEEGETRRQTQPPPPPAFSDSTPYNMIAFSARPTLGMLWKHYNPTGPFSMQGFSQLSNEDSLDITDIEKASISRCNLQGQLAYILSYGKLSNEPGVSVNSTQVHFPDELIKNANDMVLDLTGGSYGTSNNSNGAANGTLAMNATREEQTQQDGTGQRLSGQKRKSQDRSQRLPTPPQRQRRSPTPPQRHIQRTHTSPKRRNQTSSRILTRIRRRSASVKLIKKYSGELWSKWRADYEPNCTHTLHMDAFCKYVVYEMIKGRFGSKLKILYELLYQHQDHYKVAIHEDDIRKFKQRLIAHCRSWREQYGRFMFIPNAVDPIPQYLGYTLPEP